MALATDREGLLLRKVVLANGGSQPVLEGLNYFYRHVVPQILSAYPIDLGNGRHAVFTNPFMSRPDINDLQGNGRPRPLLPFEARRQKLSYMAKLFAKLEIRQTVNGQSVTVPGQSTDVYLGKIPVGIGTELCHTYGMTPEERRVRGEPEKDPQGYFIVKGTEKLLLNIERLRLNQIILFEDKNGYIARYTSQTLTDTTINTVFEDKYDLHVTFSRLGTIDNSINIFYIFYVLGLTDNTVETVYRFMDTFIVDENPTRQARRRKEMRYYMETTANSFRTQSRGDPYQILETLAGKFRDPTILQGTQRYNVIVQIVRSDLFKNIPIPTTDDPNALQYALLTKIRLLASMAAKYVDFINGYREIDDRDAWSVKRLEDPARHLRSRFVQIWKTIIDDIRKNVITKRLQSADQIRNEINQNKMTEQFVNSFTKETWGPSRGGNREVNIVDTLNRDNLVSAAAHIRRISTPTNRRAKIRDKRMIHLSSWMVVCPTMSPEGDACTTLSTTITRADGSETTMGELKDGDEVLTINPVTLEQSASRITRHFIKSSAEYGKPILKVTSMSGREIVCTDDHPFLTQLGWVHARDLNPNVHLIGIYPGVKPFPHTVAQKQLVLDEQLFRSKLNAIGVKPSLIDKHTLDLQEKGFFPLMNDDPRLVILARICGLTISDGSLGLNDGNVPRCSFIFGRPYDAELFCQDIEKLGFHRGGMRYVVSNITDKESGYVSTHHVWEVRYTGFLASLLMALGLTYGKRTMVPSKPVPQWIRQGSLAVKREFLAGFQGGDGSKVIWNKRTAPGRLGGKLHLGHTINSKCPEHVDTLIVFMNELSDMFQEFGIKVRGVDKEYRSEDRCAVLLNFSNTEENIIKYVETIGYRYAVTKSTESYQLVEYLKYKHGKIQERAKFKEYIVKRTNEGARPVEIARELNVDRVSVASVLTNMRGEPKNGTLAPKDTIGVEEWLQRSKAHNNCVFMPIKSITPDAPCMVADFTTVSDNHSMISNGFVTHNCGLVKDSAVTVFVSIDRGDALVRARINGMYSTVPTDQMRHPVYLNGVPLGYCNGPVLRDELRRLRRSMQIYFDTGIVLDKYTELWIWTTDGRACRPLLLVDQNTQELIIDQKGLRDTDLLTLLREGAMEYIDVAEQEQTDFYVAEKVDVLSEKRNRIQTVIEHNRRLTNDPDTPQAELQSSQAALRSIQNERKYTHCEIDPTAMLGISASVNPFPEFQPAPRNTFQSSMVRQALGPNSSRIELRYDTTMRTILEPGVPSVATDAHEILGLDQYPQGYPLVIAVTTYYGGNQEDALIMNEGSIDRGLFTMMIYHSYTVTVCQSGNHREEIRLPDYRPGQASRYAKLDPTTHIVPVGTIVTEKDCLVGKVIIDNTGAVRDDSLYVSSGKEGVVDDVYVTENAEACRLVRIRIREMRKLQPGDKLASRYSQKGTIGEILPEVDMPVIVSEHPELNGIRPDVLFNPHGIPSRMTMGKLFEIMLGMWTAITGQRYNATAFRRFNYQDFVAELRRRGFPRSEAKMINGITGRVMDVEIFVGVTYYQLLRHLVADKMEARGTGTVQFLTRQPIRGIRRGGALRFGEMERDALIEAGASYLLQERMSVSSDAQNAVVCRGCGQLAVSDVDTGQFRCNHCPTGTFTRVTVPHAFLLMSQYLSALNVKLSLRTKDV